jgi:hypothetical protein
MSEHSDQEPRASEGQEEDMGEHPWSPPRLRRLTLKNASSGTNNFTPMDGPYTYS